MNSSNYDFSKIIKKASKTFYISSLFFPKNVRRDVHILYAFLRVSDDLVDSVPPQEEEFTKLKTELHQSLDGKKSNDSIIESFSDLVRRKGINQQVVFDYLDIQGMDLKKRSYSSYEELDKFIYGVAGVVGLMMAKVMSLKEESFSGAMKLASAMQNVNIIRDIAEDLSAGKVYLPQDELRKFNLPDKLSKEVVEKQPEEYSLFIKFQLDRAKSLLIESRESFKFIPDKIVLPIKIVAQIYEEVINRITAKPYLVFERKMKPSVWTIIKISFKNYFL
jgi:phytoene synthase